MKHYLKIICKESNKNEIIDFYLNKHQVIITNDNNDILYDSNTYIAKGDDNDQKEKEGQKTENNKSE